MHKFFAGANRSSLPDLCTLDPLLDVDPVARMESFRVLKSEDPNGVFSHHKTLTIGLRP